MKCPSCGTEVHTDRKRCDCGFDIKTEKMKQHRQTRSFPCTTEKFHGLVSDLENWLISQNFNCQQLTTEDGGTLDKYTVLQVAKKGGWRKFVGMGTALNIVLYQKPNHIIVEIGAGRWVDKATVGTVSMFVLWPLAFAAGFGAWQQIKLPKKIYQYISEKCNNY